MSTQSAFCLSYGLQQGVFTGTSTALNTCGTTHLNNRNRTGYFTNNKCNGAIIKSSVSLSESVRHALSKKFADEDITRVLKSFSNAMGGEVLEKDEDKASHRRATSYIEDLGESKPFYERQDYESDERFEWIKYLETNYDLILNEFNTVTNDDNLLTKGTNVWAPPVVEAATTYGPDWRTLVLQDRQWDKTNTEIFPITTKLVKDSTCPTVEVFFAKQKCNTGIKLHTDDCNFILTMHLGLMVPANNESWIRVGGVKRFWENGKSLVFDTSFYHETMNESDDVDRIVLLIRFWHPDLSSVEKLAITYLFQLIEDPENHPDIIQAKNDLLKLNDTKKKSKATTTPGRGFGSNN